MRLRLSQASAAKGSDPVEDRTIFALKIRKFVVSVVISGGNPDLVRRIDSLDKYRVESGSSHSRAHNPPTKKKTIVTIERTHDCENHHRGLSIRIRG